MEKVLRVNLVLRALVTLVQQNGNKGTGNEIGTGFTATPGQERARGCMLGKTFASFIR